jgi:broad specificity phosphatase PhoE
LSNVYLVRHGQAGTRDAYDSLSAVGKRQARLLGEYFVGHNIRFTAAYAGALLRQQQTAEEVRGAFADSDVSFPPLILDHGWDEFDLGRVYQEIAPQLALENPGFRREYEEMRAQVEANLEAHSAPIHRRWLPCDTEIVRAWIRGRFPYGGETWNQFCERVAACRLKIIQAQRQENVIVFTSATPVAIWTAMSLDISDERVMRLAGALLNSAYSILRLRGDDLRLLSFNAVPHLDGSHLCTYR